MRYITTVEVAKMIRTELKNLYPNDKFSIRSDHGSIKIHYRDGTNSDLIKAVVNKYEGAGFDGSIDLQYYKTHYKLPDGSIHLLRNSGSESSGGADPYVEYPKPSPAEEVSLQVKYVFVTHSYSTEAVTKAVDMATAEYWEKSNLCVKIYPAGEEYWSSASWDVSLTGLDFYEERNLNSRIREILDKGLYKSDPVDMVRATDKALASVIGDG